MAAHLDRAERLTAIHEDVRELVHVLGGLRWRLGLERSLLFLVRGVMASAITLVGLAVAAWLSLIASWTELAWLMVAPPMLAVLLAVLRWPSDRQAALAADRRLALEERLGTAVELANRLRAAGNAGGRFDRLQIRDAVARARAAPRTWLAFDRNVRREVFMAWALIALAVVSLGLPGVPRPGLPTAEPTAPVLETLPGPPAGADRAELDSTDLLVSEAQPIQQAPADAGLASRVQQQQAERAALDALAEAVGRISAGQAAADAIQRGDFAAARDQLSNLGEEADQLSDAAKQRLRQALQQAAAASAATDRQLADRERQAAQALSRNTYVDQQQALRNLADQVERSGARTVSADQMARDVGRLQQAAGQGSSAQGPRAPGQGPQGQVASTDEAGAAANQAAGAGQSGAGTGDQQGSPGVGTGTNPDSLGDQPSPLDAAGERVEVPSKLGAGPGVRPPTGTEDQTGVDPRALNRNVSELVQSQHTGKVAPEQNLVPSERRPVVQGYFR